MEQYYDSEIHLDNNGQPDVDYYIQEAKRLRSLAISQLMRGIGEWLKLHLGRLHQLPMRPSL